MGSTCIGFTDLAKTGNPNSLQRTSATLIFFIFADEKQIGFSIDSGLIA